ncbi:MAG: ADP-ribosylation/crystallin J1, partial [Bacteroidota bacterium]
MFLFRPVNQAELDLIQQLHWKAFPPRLKGQPIFYPVLNQAYAEQITKEWNVPAYGIGHVLKFEVADTFISGYDVQKVGLDHRLVSRTPNDDRG